MKISLAVGLAASLLLANSSFFAGPVFARGSDHCCIAVPPYRAGFSLDVLVDGVPLPQIRHRGKVYVEAPWNKDFELRITCRGYERYLAVCSVDGLSIMNGRPASSRDSGYVIENGSITIPGFRLDQDNVAHFRFGDKSASYANLMGHPRNVGVIGVKLYADADRRSYVVPYPYSPHILEYRGNRLHGGPAPHSSDGSGSGPTFGDEQARSERLGAARLQKLPAMSSSLDHDMGTEFGARTNYNTRDISFNRGAIVASFSIEYASHDKLVSAGILPIYRNVVAPPVPDPFPADSCPPPPGWRG